MSKQRYRIRGMVQVHVDLDVMAESSLAALHLVDGICVHQDGDEHGHLIEIGRNMGPDVRVHSVDADGDISPSLGTVLRRLGHTHYHGLPDVWRVTAEE